MKTSEWTRNEFFEDSYLHMHKFKPDIFWKYYSREEYDVRISYQGKEALMEHRKGFPVAVIINGQHTTYKNTYAAEVAVNKFLRGE